MATYLLSEPKYSVVATANIAAAGALIWFAIATMTSCTIRGLELHLFSTLRYSMAVSFLENRY
jgi:hypothetical protein